MDSIQLSLLYVRAAFCNIRCRDGIPLSLGSTLQSAWTICFHRDAYICPNTDCRLGLRLEIQSLGVGVRIWL